MDEADAFVAVYGALLSQPSEKGTGRGRESRSGGPSPKGFSKHGDLSRRQD